jgi:hypothetical protein
VRLGGRCVCAALVAPVLAVLAVGGGLGGALGGRGEGPGDGLSFNRDVRPILSNHCFQCHGPDRETREAGLRFDVREAALAPLGDGRRAIVPGDPGASELIRRVTHPDPGVVMPPPDVGEALTAEQVETLRSWIASGAAYERHWAFEPPRRPPAPEVADEGWSLNPIDAFVLARLEREGLAPSPPASRSALLRRVSFDLTGLPPEPEEVEAFLSDGSPGAYERVVDRLLASPRHAEHMARRWLDAARYGDTHGLHLDNARQMWPWRDWVIGAFAENMPYDRFTVEQLAGDLLPEPTLGQLVATGFNRNHVSTAEGGVIDAEVQMNNVADRVATTGTVWLGLTMSCAHCHDHKYDPISHTEYFEFFAFFNNSAEEPLDGNRADWAPFVRVPSPEQTEAMASLDRRIEARREALEAPDGAVDAAQEAWRAEAAEAWRTRWHVPPVVGASSAGGATLTVLDDGSVLAGGENPDTDVYELELEPGAGPVSLVRLEALTHESLPHTGPGRAENANFVLSEVELAWRPEGGASWEPVTLTAPAADHEQANGPFPISAAVDGQAGPTNGWAVEGFNRREDRVATFAPARPFNPGEGGRVRVRLRFETQYAQHAIGRVRVALAGDGALRETLAPVALGPWRVAGPFMAEGEEGPFEAVFWPEARDGAQGADASGEAWAERPELRDGVAHALEGEQCATYLARTVHADRARRLTVRLGTDDAVKLWLNGELVHAEGAARGLTPDEDTVELSLRPGENRLLMKVVNYLGGYAFAFRAEQPDAGAFLRALPLVLEGAGSPEDEAALRRYYRAAHSPEMRALASELGELEAERAALESSLPLTLVMADREGEPRPTHRLHRGEYDKPRERVEPGVPAALPPLSPDEPRDRLGLARWLVRPDHPLTARVTVNRLWQHSFGTGLVKTVEDFGSQGEWPSHPELLDWLAVEFVESGWDVRHIVRLIVTSRTYRQSAGVSPELLSRDPENRLLARGPRFRLEAEEIRDQALLASGLLVERVGGPSVKPYQPPGLWKEVAYAGSDTTTYVPDDGEGRHRRSMYTYWKRTSPPPSMAAFDAPTREACVVRRSRTTTPLQSLVLFNDPQFVEAARALAALVAEEASGAEDRLRAAFVRVTSRPPEPGELAVLADLYEAELAHFRARPEEAGALVGAEGVGASRVELAALTVVAGAILSLDEALTR